MQNQSIKKICIYGVGGVGGYFGTKITDTKSDRIRLGYETYFIARGDHLNVINKNGIKLLSPTGSIIGVPSLATQDIREIPDPDLLLLCVKGYDLNGAVKTIKPKIGPDTVIIPLLNGADIYDRIRTNLSEGIVLPACVFVGTHIKEAGVIEQNGGDGKILLGKDPRFLEYDPSSVLKVFNDFEINFQWDDCGGPQKANNVLSSESIRNERN